MFTKINKGLGFFLMLIIGGNGSAPLMVNTKIYPVAAALLNFFNSFCRLTFQGLKLRAYFEHNCFHASIRLHENKA